MTLTFVLIVPSKHHRYYISNCKYSCLSQQLGKKSEKCMYLGDQGAVLRRQEEPPLVKMMLLKCHRLSYMKGILFIFHLNERKTEWQKKLPNYLADDLCNKLKVFLQVSHVSSNVTSLARAHPTTTLSWEGPGLLCQPFPSTVAFHELHTSLTALKKPCSFKTRSLCMFGSLFLVCLLPPDTVQVLF